MVADCRGIQDGRPPSSVRHRSAVYSPQTQTSPARSTVTARSPGAQARPTSGARSAAAGPRHSDVGRAPAPSQTTRHPAVDATVTAGPAPTPTATGVDGAPAAASRRRSADGASGDPTATAAPPPPPLRSSHRGGGAAPPRAPRHTITARRVASGQHATPAGSPAAGVVAAISSCEEEMVRGRASPLDPLRLSCCRALSHFLVLSLSLCLAWHPPPARGSQHRT